MRYQRSSSPRSVWTRWLFGVSGVLLVAASGGELEAQIGTQIGGLPLVDAVKRQDTEALSRLVERQVDLDATEADGATALHWAVYQDDLDVARVLIRAGADAAASNDHGVTSLSLACTNANAEMVTALLAAGADANAAVESGENVLMTCARTGNVDAVEALLAAGARVNAKEFSERQSALMWAAAQRHPAVVRLLIEHGADVQARSSVRRLVISRRLQSNLKYGELGRNYGTDAEETDVGGFTPLLFAARHGDIESARLLLEAGASVHETAPDGSSVLVIAVHSGHGALAKFLLEQGANPNAAGVGYTALHAAVMTGDLDVVEALLAHGARPNAQVTQATKVTRNGQVLMLEERLLGATPFALAAKYTEVEIMRALVAGGADAALPLKIGWTPLMLAASAGWRYGVWDRRDRVLPREMATQAELIDAEGTWAAVQVAIDAGADVDVVDAIGNTALHHIVDKGFDRAVELLVVSGADVNATNSRGQTPLAIVARARSGNREAAPATVELLRVLGAR